MLLLLQLLEVNGQRTKLPEMEKMEKIETIPVDLERKKNDPNQNNGEPLVN